jgi:hypothetical protein
MEIVRVLHVLNATSPGCLFDDVLYEDEPRVQSSLDLLQEVEDLVVVCGQQNRRETGYYTLYHTQDKQTNNLTAD